MVLSFGGRLLWSGTSLEESEQTRSRTRTSLIGASLITTGVKECHDFHFILSRQILLAHVIPLFEKARSYRQSHWDLWG